MATSIVGAVVYLQRAQMAAIQQIAKLLRPSEDTSSRLAELRHDVRELDHKVDALSTQLAGIAVTVDNQGKRLSSGRLPAVRD